MDRYKATIGIVAAGYWSQASTNGALRVVVPVYFAARGMSITKILLFFFIQVCRDFAPVGIGVMLNRWVIRNVHGQAFGASQHDFILFT